MTSESTEPEIVVATCPHCNISVQATKHGDVTFGDETVPDLERVTLFQCGSCGGPLLYAERLDCDQTTTDLDYRWIVTERLWPQPSNSLSSSIPLSLRREYEQARKCYEAGAYTAAAVMVRRTLEGVCIENKFTQKPLSRALPKMHEAGLIDTRLLEWAQALRVLGNEAAHFTGHEVSREDAGDGLDLAEALLDYMYVLTVKFREFIDRRSEHARTKPNDS